jgi:hypothetical protein
MRTIELFMWGYQTHFQISAKVAAEAIFSRLSQGLDPKVFLVGILNEERQDRHPICLEPEDSGYEPRMFVNAKEQAMHLEAVDEERHIIHSHSAVQETRLRRLKRKALKNAVQQAVNQFDEYRGVISFCSWPILVEGYQVIVVLQLDRKEFHSYYSLTQNMREGFTIATSLLDATIQEFLDHCADALNKPNPGASPSLLDRDYDEIIRAAGKQLMYIPAYATYSFEGLYKLFEACNTISSLKYEGIESVGRMIIAQKSHPNIEVVLSLSNAVELRDYRAVRKLLEMSSGEISLLSDADYIYGLGKTIGVYDQRAEDMFLIQFTKHYTWELVHGNHLLMRTTYGQPELPRVRVDKHKFATDVTRIFSGISTKQITNLWQLVLEAAGQKHGTMVVISAGAAEEAKRLASQATIIEPIQLTEQVMRLVTAIDGAVLIDISSTCYAIGVILDGLASKKGTPARGARYNSAIRYVETSKHPCIAIVISEDGSIDLIPNLMPQIPRSTVEEAMAELRKLTDEKYFDFKKFSKTMEWLNNHKFYLLPEICHEINSLRREIEIVRDRLIEPTALRIVYSDFIPNEDMNESYFLVDSNQTPSVTYEKKSAL